MLEGTQFPIVSSFGLMWLLPFVGLLLSIALVPMLAADHWLEHNSKWTAFWALAFLVPAAAIRGVEPAARALAATAQHEYVPFILLLGALYIVTGGIHISGTPRGSPAVNTVLLAVGTVLAGVIGTMASSLLLIRPLIRANRGRRRRLHLFIFYVVLVANVGGALSPLGNPPLLLGYLEGVPLLWPLQHLWQPTLILGAALLVTFYVIDHYLIRRDARDGLTKEAAKLGIAGGINLVLLPCAIATVVLAPIGVADALYVVIAALSLWLTPKHRRRANEFSWEPIGEVAVLFAGIFVTLIPVIGLIATGAQGPAALLLDALIVQGAPNNLLFFAATGLLSAFVDNAPTYLVFFNFAGGDAARLTTAGAPTLAAVTAGAAYFGALTYIGSAPNLMVKSLAEKDGVPMPGFFAFTGLTVLIAGPWLALIALLFFR